MNFLNYLISGISLGSIYAIIALGYTMVYGIAKMLNFAHGDIIMVGSYVVYVLTTMHGVNPLLSVLISVVCCTVAGIVIELVAYRPLRNAASNLAVLITAIGVSYLLQNIALLIFGSDPKAFTNMIPWQSHKERAGHAGSVGGQRGGDPDGDQCKSDDLADLCHRFSLGGHCRRFDV